MFFLLEAELRCTGQIDGPLCLSVPPSVAATVVVGGAGLGACSEFLWAHIRRGVAGSAFDVLRTSTLFSTPTPPTAHWGPVSPHSRQSCCVLWFSFQSVFLEGETIRGDKKLDFE